MSELYDLSKAAREMRSQLASSLQQAQIEHKYGSLKESMRKSRFLVGYVMTFRCQLTKYILYSITSCRSKGWCFGIIGCSGPFVSSNLSFSWLCIGAQVQPVRMMVKADFRRGSMSRLHARRHFLTTYFDPFYADLYIHPNKPEYNYDTNLFAFFRRRSSEPSYAVRLGIEGPIDQIQRSITDAVAQVQRFMWESWGTGDDRIKAWPPT